MLNDSFVWVVYNFTYDGTTCLSPERKEERVPRRVLKVDGGPV